MKKTLFSILLCSMFAQAQNVTIAPGGITPALTGTYQRITYDAILALPSPVIGDQAYDITFLCMRVFNGNRWVCTYQLPDDPVVDKAIIASAGGTSIDFGNSVAVDPSGNVYVTGQYSGTATFGATSKTSVGNSDIFIAKYNSSGTLQWVQSAGGTSFDYGLSVAVDPFGNVYVTGYYQGTATFGATSKNSAGSADIFIAKYNTSGTFQWVQSAGGTSDDYGHSVAVDATGNVYVTGYFQGIATFGATSKTSVGLADIFIAKYNTSGTLQWVQSAGGTSSDVGNSIAVDATGNVYVTGYYSGTTTFGATSKTSAGNADIFIAKYDPVGTSWLWVQSAGGPSDDVGRSIAVDASDNVYVTGYYFGTTTFGATSKTSAGNADIFIAKYNTSGTLQWVQSAGGTLYDYGLSVAVDPFGNVYVTGYYQGTATFGATSKNSAGSADIFIAKYNTSGTFQWVQSAGGTSYDQGSSIAVDPSGNVYVTGYFQGTATFGATSKSSVGNYDVFLGRISQ